jgi:hypothetical protein
MRRIEQIEAQILKLSPEEFAELRDWFVEQDWRMWDARIESAVRAGKIERIAYTEVIGPHETRS